MSWNKKCQYFRIFFGLTNQVSCYDDEYPYCGVMHILWAILWTTMLRACDVGTVQGLPDDSFTLLAWQRFVVCPHGIKHLWLTSLRLSIQPHHSHCSSFHCSSILIFKKKGTNKPFLMFSIQQSIKNRAVKLVTQSEDTVLGQRWSLPGPAPGLAQLSLTEGAHVYWYGTPCLGFSMLYCKNICHRQISQNQGK